MKFLKAMALALLLAGVSTSGLAQDKKKVLNPWIDCGIGAMLFDETGWAAVISNVIWDLGTTAVTSDQSSQHTCNSKSAKTALYIGTTYANLTDETVKGDGRHLRAMLEIAGCQAASHEAAIGMLRADFAQYLRSDADADKSRAARAEDFYNLVQKSLQSECRIG